MARRPKPQDDEPQEEVTEEVEAAVEEEAAPAGAEFVPEAAHKPKSDVYSAMLILTFFVFLAGAWIAGREAWEHYDVQFYMFSKEGKAASGGSSGPTETSTPTPPPEKQ